MSWINSDWMKEWKNLALRSELGKVCGYWYYDINDRTYKYIKL